MTIRNSSPFRFCWADLAATDADAAKSFYGPMFGWKVKEHSAGHGQLTQLMLGEIAIASIYQLNRHHLANGVPSHWTPYVAVGNIEEMAAKAKTLGGAAVVEPFDVPGIARVCLIQDPVGALVGLWQTSE